MLTPDYSKSYSRISNKNRQGLIEASQGKNPSKCILHHDKDSNTLFIGTPNQMTVNASGSTVDRISRLYSSVVDSIVPIAMPRAV